ncbi:MAG: glycoside hydrolase family 26 protein [Oscillospiraceae bacterium]|nr:glycoside hydrolase family 26 protein [Oscillospiraceae bacterium]
MKKRLLSVFCVLALALNITACGKAESASQTSAAALSETSGEAVLSLSETTSETTTSVTTEAVTSEETTTALTSETEPEVTVTVQTAAEVTETAAAIQTAAAEETTAKTTAVMTQETTAAKTTVTAKETTAKTTVTTKETTAKTTITTKETTAKTAVTTKETTAKTTVTTKASANQSSTQKLSNPNASKEAKALFEYICSTYGNGIISGQQESTWMGSDQYEFDYIYKNTGKYPAIRGLDYMNDDFSGVNKRAAAWHDKGGIVTICWHCGSDFSGSWAESMKTEIVDWNKALTKGTTEYEKLIKGMDKGAAALKELKDKNIPVLWRPFHEFDGAWFWWGKGGAENFKKLWTIMYDRYTNYWGLDNLIWVLGYSGNGKNYDSWYPGDKYVDIAGADSYSDGANGNLYTNVCKVVGDTKPVCFHECGRIPTVEQLKNASAKWVWFMTWHTEHITDHNDTKTLKEIYNDDYVITLDELPKLY